MYITINDVIGKKTIDVSYPVKDKDGSCRPCSMDIAVVSMLSDNVQYWLQGHLKVELKSGEEIMLNKGVFFILNHVTICLTTHLSAMLEDHQT